MISHNALMKKSLHKFLIVACLLMSGLPAAIAQDAAVQDFELTESERDRYERDKVIFSPGGENESRFMSPRAIPGGNSKSPTDSTGATKTQPQTQTQTPHNAPAGGKIKHEQQTVKPPVKPAPPKEDDDAILSFNFLYYIIQKYKLQEIID